MQSKICGAPAPLQADAYPDAAEHTPLEPGEPRDREPFRLSGGRIGLKLGKGERELLAGYAHDHSIPLSEAARRMIRLALEKPPPDPEGPYRLELWTEVIMHTLIQGEQVLLMLQALTPYGRGPDDLLVQASHAAQVRLARGHDPDVDPVGTEALVETDPQPGPRS
jgi:hypothetical protein